LWSKARNRQWTIALQNSEPEAVIDPQKGVPREQYFKGSTSIFAKVIRVGGNAPSVLVQLPNNERRTFVVSGKEVAQQLGGMLYQRVVLHGDARWLRGNRKLADFKVRKVGGYSDNTANPAETMKDLSRIMGHHWDGVNADEYLKEERYGD
jgi:hypothetical protein